MDPPSKDVPHHHQSLAPGCSLHALTPKKLVKFTIAALKKREASAEKFLPPSTPSNPTDMEVDPKEPTVKKVATPAPEPQPEPEPTTIQTFVAKIQDALPISPVLSPPSAPSYLNCRISVYWPKMRKYYQGRVGAEVSDGKISVTYDDGDVEYLDLDKERWTMIQEPDHEYSSVDPEPEVESDSELEPKSEPETVTGLPWTEKETAVLLAGVATHGKGT